MISCGVKGCENRSSVCVHGIGTVYVCGKQLIGIGEDGKCEMRTGETVETGLFDVEEVHENCTVQILRNSVTGEQSIGWWENNEID